MVIRRLIEAAATARLAEVVKVDAVRPIGPAVALSGRTDAQRIMLLGGGLTSGWGVRTHGLALVGSLQRAVQDRLRVPVDVSTVTEFGIEMAGAVDLLRRQERDDLDAVVVVFGASDALRFTPVRLWRQGLERLLAELDSRAGHGPSVPVVVAGIPPVDSLTAFRSTLTPLLRRHAETLNAVTRQVVARSRAAVFAPLPAMAASTQRPFGSPAAYGTWAEAIADGVVSLMPAAVGRVGDVALRGGAVGAWPARVLAQPDGLRARLEGVVVGLREELGADFALVGLLNGEQIWTVADSLGRDPRSVDLDATYCATTLREGFLHVPDAAVDPRFAELEPVRAFHLRAYAGVMLEGPDGEPIGTVCVFNGAVSREVDEGALRRAAARVEEALTGRTAAPHLLAPAASPARPAASRRLPDAPPVAPARDALPDRVGRAGSVLTRRAHVLVGGSRLTRIAQRRTSPVEQPFEVAGPRPIRILLVGGEYAVGFGAATRAEAVDGAIARLIHARTGRGVVVENRARYRVRLPELATSLGPLHTADFDVVLWAPTFIEAARTVFRRRWRTAIGAMIRTVETGSRAAVVLLGFPALLGAQPLAIAGRARAAQVNRVLRAIAAEHPRVLVAEPPPLSLKDVDSLAGADVYHDVAVRLLPTILELVEPDEDAAEVEREPALAGAR